MVLWGRNGTTTAETARICREAGAEVYTYLLDLSSDSAIDAAAKQVINDVGDVDILINNAGVTYIGTICELDREDIKRVINVNLLAQFWTVKAFLPAMLEANAGHVVAISSICSYIAVPGEAAYIASKFASNGFMETLANELVLLNKTGVKTTTVCPSFVDTPMCAPVEIDPSVKLMNAGFVADTIIEAILIDQELIITPKLMYLIYALKGLCPAEIYKMLITQVFSPTLLRLKANA